jgi:alcohol dehydrogenase-like protein
MRALVWHGTTDIRCDRVPDPTIEDDRDAIIKVTSCAICGSDLHLFDHFMPGMKKGDIMGHETMGEVHNSCFPYSSKYQTSTSIQCRLANRVVTPSTVDAVDSDLECSDIGPLGLY